VHVHEKVCELTWGILCFVFLIVEEKKHKLTELKTGLDEADSLVLIFDFLLVVGLVVSIY